MDGHRCFSKGEYIPYYRFWWVVEHRSFVQGLKLMVITSKMGYIREVQEVVRLNLSHMELLVCSDIPFQKCVDHCPQNACCTKKNISTTFWQSL
jgi:hypothetical protein